MQRSQIRSDVHLRPGCDYEPKPVGHSAPDLANKASQFVFLSLRGFIQTVNDNQLGVLLWWKGSGQRLQKQAIEQRLNVFPQ